MGSKELEQAEGSIAANRGRDTVVETNQVSRQDCADPAPVVVLEDVEKSFNSTTVIRFASLQITRGHIFGLVGPSGCGKTTLVRIMVGSMAPTSGTVQVLDADPVRFTTRERERIGYMPQRFFLYPTLTIEENLSFVAGLYGIGWVKRRRRIQELLEVFELWDARHRLAQHISGGMQRRLELACALVHSPEVLFVDEPTTGLDPILRARIWDYLRGLRDRETTIVLTTQYLEEAEYCDRLAVMSEGRIVASGTPGDLRRQALQGDVLEIGTEHLRSVDMAALRELDCVSRIEWSGQDTVLLYVTDIEIARAKIAEVLEQHGIPLEALRTHTPKFDEVFIRLVSRHG